MLLGAKRIVAHVVFHVAMNFGGGFERLLAFKKADDVDGLRGAAKVVDGEVLGWLRRAKVVVLILVACYPTDNSQILR